MILTFTEEDIKEQEKFQDRIFKEWGLKIAPPMKKISKISDLK